MASIDRFLSKSYEQHEFAGLIKDPVVALEGVSAGDAEALEKAFGIR